MEDKKEPILDPERELPAPHDMELPQPHDMLLTQQHFTQRHSWIHWLPAIFGLIIGLFIGVFIIGGANEQKNLPIPTSTTAPIPTSNVTNAMQPTITLTPTATPFPTRLPVLDSQTGPIFCTQDVMTCPDGSTVARIGPKCEFAPCTTQQP